MLLIRWLKNRSAAARAADDIKWPEVVNSDGDRAALYPEPTRPGLGHGLGDEEEDNVPARQSDVINMAGAGAHTGLLHPKNSLSPSNTRTGTFMSSSIQDHSSHGHQYYPNAFQATSPSPPQQAYGGYYNPPNGSSPPHHYPIDGAGGGISNENPSHQVARQAPGELGFYGDYFLSDSDLEKDYDHDAYRFNPETQQRLSPEVYPPQEPIQSSQPVYQAYHRPTLVTGQSVPHEPSLSYEAQNARQQDLTGRSESPLSPVSEGYLPRDSIPTGEVDDPSTSHSGGTSSHGRRLVALNPDEPS